MKKILLVLLLLSCGPTSPDYVSPQFTKPHHGDVFRVGDVVPIEYTNGSVPRLAVQVWQGKIAIKFCHRGWSWTPSRTGVWHLELLDWKFLCAGYHTSSVYDKLTIFVE